MAFWLGSLISLKLFQTNGGITKHPSARKSVVEASVARQANPNNDRDKREITRPLSPPCMEVISIDPA
jgi:hypothetical protein